MQAKKEVSFKGRACRVGKVDALSALWIISVIESAQLVASKKLTFGSSGGGNGQASGAPNPAQAEEMIAVGWAVAGLGASREEQREVQQMCLATCEAKNESGIYEAVMTGDGRWVQESVSGNLQLVNFLVVETLKYNLASFFTEGASEAAVKPQASAPSAPKPLTPTPGARS